VILAAALLPVAPLVAALLGLLLPNRARRPAIGLGVAAAAVALIAAVTLAIGSSAMVTASRQIVDFGNLSVTLTLRVDPRAALVAIAVAVVALAVQVYSIAYLHDDRYPPYAAQVSLFTAAMMLVVVSGDLVLLLIGWEVMGICSYLLIGHDRSLPEAPRAAVKAFVVTRVGDVGFLLGIALLVVPAGTSRISEVLATHYSPARLTVATLLLLCGVAGKSAQFPLHTWLPDAMAGPTPISALIHAATMVAAGVYVVTRLYPLFLGAPATLATLGVIAAITMLLAALAAAAQDDIKRVLAWSTVSQIAYMSGALAVGAAPVALFHLLAHAAFKALLFLAAGCVIHAVGSNSMSVMGGLRKALPVTFWCTTIGLAALAGVPPFAGFWSKDEVLAVAADARYGAGPAAAWVGWLVWLTGLGTALATAWYASRLWLRVFFGPWRGGAPTGAAVPGDGPVAPDAVEAPPLMRWPVVILAIPSALLGFLGLDKAFAHRLGAGSLSGFDALAVLPLACLVIGAGLAYWRWRTEPTLSLGAAGVFFASGWRLDQVQDALVVRPVQALARVTLAADRSIVDGTVESTGRGTLRLSAWIARAHREPLPRAIGAALGGAVLIGLVTVLVVGAR
jgi:NADH-quinone oxidoreductase subunit L